MRLDYQRRDDDTVFRRTVALEKPVRREAATSPVEIDAIFRHECS
jgi:hypothetical protein